MSFHGPIRCEYSVPCDFSVDEDTLVTEEVTVVCEESFSGAALAVLEVYRDVGGTVRDVFAELDQSTLDALAYRCERLRDEEVSEHYEEEAA